MLEEIKERICESELKSDTERERNKYPESNKTFPSRVIKLTVIK